MTYLSKLDGEKHELQSQIQRCNHRARDAQNCLRQEEEARQEAKERLEEAVTSTFSQLRITFDALEAAMRGINEGRNVNIENIEVPTFGVLDDLKSFCSQSVNEISRESEEKGHQLEAELSKLENHADKLQALQNEEISELNLKKFDSENKRSAIEFEKESKSKALAEREERKREKEIEQLEAKNLRRFRSMVVYELNENARYAQLRRRSQQILSRIEDECRQEIRLRLVLAYENGDAMVGDYDEDDIERAVDHMVKERIAILKAEY